MHAVLTEPDGRTREFYLRSLAALDRAQVPYLVGGGYAMACYTGIVRHTKDLDVFVHPRDSSRTLGTLAAAGYRVEMTWPHFLGKAIDGQAFVDIIYNSANGLCPVDDQWFAHACEGDVLGRRVPLCPAEEVLWTKAFVQDRERFDGADVAHLLLARGGSFDWQRLIDRFRSHERLLLSHLVLFGYVYPSERQRVPGWVIESLVRSMAAEPPVADRVCRGTFLAQSQYLTDIGAWGFTDARLQPQGPLTPEDIDRLSAA